MKSLSLLKKIALGSGVVASIAPIALMSTSCAIESIDADYIEFNDIFHEKDYTKVSVGSKSFKRLLFGSKKVYNGNYVLFTGSNIFDSTCKFFSGHQARRAKDQWFKTKDQVDYGHFWDGYFFEGIEKTSGTAIKNFGIFNVVDYFDGHIYDKKGHEIVVYDKPEHPTQLIGPWDKWTDAMITQTKLYNKNEHGYEWDEKSVTTKDYIREDSSAKAYRAFVQTGLQAYPTNDKRKKSFDVADGNKSSKMMVFVDGKLQSQGKDEKEIVDILDIPTSKEAWYDIIIKYFKDEEKKPEK